MTEQYDSNKFRHFIADNRQDSPSRLRFRYHGKEGDVDYMLAITQIEFIQKFKDKLPEFIASGCRVPDISVAEQSTNEKVAGIHASFVGNTGEQVVDLTAGLGIDIINIARRRASGEILALEIDEKRAATLKWNLSHLNINNVKVVCDDCRNFIDQLPAGCTVFIDPARRTNDRRVYSLRESQPDIIELTPIIMKHASRLFIKCSPMIDISSVLKELDGIGEVYVISVNNDCKEVLLMIASDENPEIKYQAINISMTRETSFGFSLRRNIAPGGCEQRHCDICSEDISDGQYYLYEPDSSVMKLTPWRQLRQKFPDLKLASKSTALFISSSLYRDFPGRILKIEQVLSSRDIKRMKGEKFNVVTRNYPLKADELKKKLKVCDGGCQYIYAFRLGEVNSKNIITICKKI